MQRRTTFFLLVFVGIVGVLGIASFLIFTVFRRSEASVAIPSDPRIPRLLDGVLVAPDTAHDRLIAVVIDAMLQGRPTVGLAAAPLVWEVPVEGGITRFLAVYPASLLPEKVGPIRSLRPYFLDFASELGALIMHVGGSPEALTRAQSAPLDRLNQFFDDHYFWRSTDREAPHNVFTSQYLVARALAERSLSSDSIISPWRYGVNDRTASPGEGKGIRIPYATPPYTMEWTWNDARHLYERSMGGERHRDANGEGIDAANVLVQFTHVAILDEIGRRRITTDGGGRAIVLTVGRTIEAQWRKNSGDRTRFFDGVTGEEIALTPGTTWIEIVPENLSTEIINPLSL